MVHSVERQQTWLGSLGSNFLSMWQDKQRNRKGWFFHSIDRSLTRKRLSLLLWEENRWFDRRTTWENRPYFFEARFLESNNSIQFAFGKLAGRGLVRSAPPAASTQRRRLISLVEAAFIYLYSTWHVGRAYSTSGSAWSRPLPALFLPTKKSDWESREPFRASVFAGRLEKKGVFHSFTAFHSTILIELIALPNNQVIMRLKTDASLAVWNMD